MHHKLVFVKYKGLMKENHNKNISINDYANILSIFSKTLTK